MLRCVDDDKHNDNDKTYYFFSHLCAWGSKGTSINEWLGSKVAIGYPTNLELDPWPLVMEIALKSILAAEEISWFVFF